MHDSAAQGRTRAHMSFASQLSHKAYHVCMSVEVLCSLGKEERVERKSGELEGVRVK